MSTKHYLSSDKTNKYNLSQKAWSTLRTQQMLKPILIQNNLGFLTCKSWLNGVNSIIQKVILRGLYK